MLKSMADKGMRSKIFIKFLFSSYVLILVTLILMTVFFFKHISDNSKIEEKRVLENKLYTLMEDMDNQFVNMSRLALKIVASEKVSQTYINKSKWNEIEIVEFMEGLQSMSDISEEQFVLFEPFDKVFTSSGSTISTDYYFSKKHNIKNDEKVLMLTEEIAKGMHERVLMYNEENITLILYPMQIYASVRTGKQGVVGFVITSSKIQERIERLIGNISADINIYYKNKCIYGDENLLNNENDTIVSVEMEEFRIIAKLNPGDGFLWKNVILKGESATLLLIIIGLLILTFVVVWWNYFPFHKISEKYFYVVNKKKALNWKDVDDMIKGFLRENEIRGEQAKEQLRELRKQVVCLILESGYSDNLQNLLVLLNIRFDASVFGLIRTNIEPPFLDIESDEVLCKNIENLSEREFSLYPFWSKENELQIFVAAEEEYQLDESATLIQSLLKMMDLHSVVEVCAKGHDLKKLHLLSEKQDKKDVKREIGAQMISNNMQNFGKQKNTVKRAIGYIKEHYTDYNLSLDMIANELQITTPYLSTILKKEIKMSYREYLAHLRVEEAKKLLREEYFSVAEVCHQVGYVNVSYFIKVFQKYTGVTPTMYRVEFFDEKNTAEKIIEGNL